MLLAIVLVARSHSILLLSCRTECYTVVENHIETHKASKYITGVFQLILIFYELTLSQKSYPDQT